MSTLKTTDRCTDIILDFVYRYESKGNYNAYYGHGDNTDSPRLVDMTITQVVAFQDQLLASGNKSSACGAPQFLKATLLSLNPLMSNRFSPQYQDAMAVSLLTRRAYSQWWRGQIDNVTFAHNLSLEWASMPDPQNAGLSHYPGQKTRYALSHVYAMLDTAKAALSQPPSPPATDYAAELRAIAARLTEISDRMAG